MHPIVQRAEVLLQSNSHPTLRPRELLRLLRPDMDQTLTEARLRTLLGGIRNAFGFWSPGRVGDDRSQQDASPRRGSLPSDHHPHHRTEVI